MPYSPTSRHYSALRQLFPLPRMAGDLDVVLDADGISLDRAEELIDDLRGEILPNNSTLDPVTGMLEIWEDIFGLAHTGSLADRRELVGSMMAATGGLNKGKFYLAASAFGYYTAPHADPHIEIIDGFYMPFRVGFGRIGIDRIYDNESGHSVFTILVKGTDVESDTNLQALFEAMARPAFEFIYINN
jgi:hypothetical protein